MALCQHPRESAAKAEEKQKREGWELAGDGTQITFKEKINETINNLNMFTIN